MPIITFNGAVVIPHPPDWRQPVEWSRSWDTRVESAVTGSEARVGLRSKPREKVRFRVVPYDLAERLALVERLKAAAKCGLALVPHWGRGSTLAAPASGATLSVEHSAFTVQPGDPVFIHTGDIDGFEAFEVVQVLSYEGRTLTLATALDGSYPAGSRVYPTLHGRISIGDLEALDDWRQAVTLEIQQLRTASWDLPPPPDPDPVESGDDYWFQGAPVPKFGWGGSFDHWLEGAPILHP